MLPRAVLGSLTVGRGIPLLFISAVKVFHCVLSLLIFIAIHYHTFNKKAQISLGFIFDL
jgi:hypothetical protein